jgi:uncharacterized membrane protein (DUF485 family)
MAGMEHGASSSPPTSTEMPSRKRLQYGLIFFSVYLLFYAGFVLLSAFAPSLMERKPFAGVNLAVLYGLGLIVLAFVMALLYDWICRALAGRDAQKAGETRN